MVETKLTSDAACVGNPGILGHPKFTNNRDTKSSTLSDILLSVYSKFLWQK